MSTTYNPANITSVNKDWVRWRVGDTNGSPQWFLQDEEINALLTSVVFPDGSIRANEVLAQCCENIATQCTQLAATVKQKNLSIQFADRGKRYLEMADRFRNEAELPPGSPLDQGAIAGPIHHVLPHAYDVLTGACPDVRREPFSYEPY